MTLIGICGPTTELDAWLYVSRGTVPGNVIALEETMASVRENLIAAKALIDTPEKWGKGAFISGSSGCLCVLGALGVAARSDAYAWNYQDANALLSVLPFKASSETSLAKFNDDPRTTHADVMALFDRAIAASTKEEQQCD